MDAISLVTKKASPSSGATTSTPSAMFPLLRGGLAAPGEDVMARQGHAHRFVWAPLRLHGSGGPVCGRVAQSSEGKVRQEHGIQSPAPHLQVGWTPLISPTAGVGAMPGPPLLAGTLRGGGSETATSSRAGERRTEGPAQER